MGNLQKGERLVYSICLLTRADPSHRYANMDFIVFFSLIGTILWQLVFSYDIACQWSRNLAKRLLQLPENMHLNVEQLAAAHYVIPKFHIYAHGLSCQSLFLLNFLPFMAQTNGEEPERWWAHINPTSMSTKEMGPGARLDTLDDHAASWNWRKITGMGKHLSDPFVSPLDLLFSGSSLATQLCKAIRMAQEQKDRHTKLTGTFPIHVIQKWEAMVAAWNDDPHSTNPYKEPVMSMFTYPSQCMPLT